MLTGEMKNKVQALWQSFYNSGMANPLTVLEQITYLMFIHDIDDADAAREKDAQMMGLPYTSMFAGTKVIDEHEVPGEQLRWSVFRDFPPEKMYSNMRLNVFPFIQSMNANAGSAFARYMKEAIFAVPTASALVSIVTAMDAIYEGLQAKNGDIRGDVYEYMLSYISSSGTNGQFRTPRHIIKMMVELMQPKPEDIICDPACGTSGFLINAAEYLLEHYKKDIFFDPAKKKHFLENMFHGYDTDTTMLRIGAMNMMVHGIDNPPIEYRNSISDMNPDTNMYSLILANPPFKAAIEKDIVSESLQKICKTNTAALLFVALFIRSLRVGGRCACIVPDGVLFGSSNAHKDLRKELVENNRLEAVISMPSGVFKPYAGVSTAILIFTKTGHGGTNKVWFYDMKADGFTLDDKRSPIAETDIPDIINRFHNLAAETARERTEQSFFVPAEEIIANGYDLSINKYKQTEYKAVEYPPTEEIMAELAELEMKIGEEMAALNELLGL